MVTIDHIRQRGSAPDLSKGGGLDRRIKDDDHNVFFTVPAGIIPLHLFPVSEGATNCNYVSILEILACEAGKPTI
jgi:hypothetical protein